jgi:hypothetical protein
VKTVLLSGKNAAGRSARVDDQDYELVSPYRWYNFEKLSAGCRPNGPYALAHIYSDGRDISLLMHTLITGWERVDHIDHDGLNNQRYNLRPVTAAQNSANKRPQLGCSSAYKGVYWHKHRSRWAVAIRIDGQRHYLGNYTDEEAAARAYDAAALAAWGEYAWLNFPSQPRA